MLANYLAKRVFFSKNLVTSQRYAMFASLNKQNIDGAIISA